MIRNEIAAIAERTVTNSKEISQREKQRRTGFVDLYGVESFKEVNGSADYYISISPDIVYFERYQFKLVISNAMQVGSVKIEIDGIDFTSYFMEQHGSWINGNGIYPTDDITEQAEWNDFYDILDACGLMGASGESIDKVLTSGLHTITISGLSADVSLILYMKYSHINR